MTDENALLEALRKNPRDRTLHGIVADFYEERDEHEKAKKHRRFFLLGTFEAPRAPVKPKRVPSRWDSSKMVQRTRYGKNVYKKMLREYKRLLAIYEAYS